MWAGWVWCSARRPHRWRGLGWDTDAHVEVLWSLSRSADADIALHTLVRLSEALGGDWPELDAALHKDRSLRGRLFAVLGSSMAFGDHLVANPRSWHLLEGDLRLPGADDLRRKFSDAIAEVGTAPTVVMPRLRSVYRDQLMILAALDLAPTVENEPVLPFTTVGEHLSDLADAALDAALQVAVANVCRAGEAPPRLAVIAMGKCGARELNYVSDVDVIFVGENADPTVTRVAGEMMRLASEAFFEVDAALRPEGKAGALVRTLRVAYRLLPAVGQDVGIPGAVEGPARRRRRRAGPALRRCPDADGVDRL